MSQRGQAPSDSCGLVQKTQAEKDHIDLLDGILDGHIELISKQAGKKPYMPMSLTEIQTVNELLSEIRTLFKGCETEDYLKLAEEPDPPNTDSEAPNPGTTYGQMAMLLQAYHHTIHAYQYDKLYYKGAFTEKT